MKLILLFILSLNMLFAHPVSYTIKLTLKYNKATKIAHITCSSDSRNKCGLHNFDLLDEDGKLIKTSKFPFLKKSVDISSDKKPSTMKFFLRKIPEHFYTVYTKK